MEGLEEVGEGGEGEGVISIKTQENVSILFS